jgi:hypothetical protein
MRAQREICTNSTHLEAHGVHVGPATKRLFVSPDKGSTAPFLGAGGKPRPLLLLAFAAPERESRVSLGESDT